MPYYTPDNSRLPAISKETLSEFAYKLVHEAHQNTVLIHKNIQWSVPVVGFAHNKSLPEKFMKVLSKADFFKEDLSSVVCVFGDWETVAEGIIFTDTSVYVHSPKNKDKDFRVKYGDIVRLSYYRNPPILRIETKEKTYTISTNLWSKKTIYNYLQFATCRNRFSEADEDVILAMELQTAQKKNVYDYLGGLIYSNVSNASSIYFDDKIVTPRGHGFAAEHMNHLADLLAGKEAHIAGDDNAKNGADRIVDGVFLQSKYCKTGSKCVEECFDKTTKLFRYWNADGSPMKIEVPCDEEIYNGAVKAMEERIRKGEVPGVTDPEEAKNIIQKGHFTYEQARNVAKAGTVESILYDATTGAIIATSAFGISAVMTFALSIWRGDEFDIAVKQATVQGLKSGGIAFVTAVLAGQLSKAGLNSMLVGSSEALVKHIGPKASAVIVNALKSGKNIYGAAAMKSLAKLLRNNFITGGVSFVVLSVADVARIFKGRISGKQLFKNLSATGASIAGGTGGWIGGAALGAKIGGAIGSIIPFAGTATGAAVGGGIGGVVGSLGAGAASGAATKKIIGHFVEDDADAMVKVLQEVFADMGEEYLINQKEADDLVVALQQVLTGKLLMEMYATEDHKAFARALMSDLFEDVSRNRQHILLPTNEQFVDGLRAVLEEIADEQAKEENQ